MRIHSVCSILFDVLRDVHGRRAGSSRRRRPRPGRCLALRRRVRTWLRTIESFLAAYYRQCGRTGWRPRESVSPKPGAGRFPRIPSGVGDGLIGVVIFSLTMPVMKIAVRDFDPVFVGIGRFVLAAIPAAITLWFLRLPVPNVRQFFSILTISACLVFGFSWSLAEALIRVPAHHVAVVAGSIPLVVAVTAAIRDRERLSVSFWLVAVVGALTVTGYGLAKSSGHVGSADLFLIGAAVAGGIGYAEGGRLGREMGALAVSCWLPLVAAPLALVVCATRMPEHVTQIPASAWLALGYNGVFSCWLGFAFWYRGLGRGGIGRIGQLQLTQPFFTLIFISLFFRESMAPGDWMAAGIVVFCAAAAQVRG